MSCRFCFCFFYPACVDWIFSIQVVWAHPVKNVSWIKNVTSPLQVKWPHTEPRNAISCSRRWPLKMATSGPIKMKAVGCNFRNVLSNNIKSILYVRKANWIFCRLNKFACINESMQKKLKTMSPLSLVSATLATLHIKLTFLLSKLNLLWLCNYDAWCLS